MKYRKPPGGLRGASQRIAGKKPGAAAVSRARAKVSGMAKPAGTKRVAPTARRSGSGIKKPTLRRR